MCQCLRPEACKCADVQITVADCSQDIAVYKIVVSTAGISREGGDDIK